MKPIDTYVERLNETANDLLNNESSSNPVKWDSLSQYYRSVSGAMATDGVFMVTHHRPTCSACNHPAFQDFMHNFSKCVNLQKQLSMMSESENSEDALKIKQTIKKYQKPVEQYLRNRKEKIEVFTKSEDRYLVMNRFTNKTFDNFMLETMLYEVGVGNPLES